MAFNRSNDRGTRAPARGSDRAVLGYLNLSIETDDGSKKRIGANGLALLEGNTVAEFLHEALQSKDGFERLRQAVIFEYNAQDAEPEDVGFKF